MCSFSAGLPRIESVPRRQGANTTDNGTDKQPTDTDRQAQFEARWKRKCGAVVSSSFCSSSLQTPLFSVHGECPMVPVGKCGRQHQGGRAKWAQ